MKKFFFIFYISFCLSFLFISCDNNKLSLIKININDKIYNFELAATEAQRLKGLMFRNKLNPNSGMFFVYPYKHQLSFYMKNTYFPIDIAFVDNNYKVVDIQSMKPLDETPILSKQEAQFALEVNEGFFAKIGLTVGDKINILSPIPYLLN